ncbi:inhibitor of growth protein 2-like [Macrosteles quadrilineatus]|uniref:inhibitor of growth protein 2-like n=1 Tax=Macrosteles quadrilineatus TaxID=74068 RepID=UPI0023E11CD4|nr:inhibitor of growth protein 2-like [Macrosteles quadrilineatus]
MLNHSDVDSIYITTYIQNYLDSLDNLPDDVARQLSRIRELDLTYQTFLKDIDHQKDIILRKDPESHVRKRAVVRLQQTLIQAQEVGDEKLQIAQQVCDLIENKARQLELDFKFLDPKSFCKDPDPIEASVERAILQTRDVQGSLPQLSVVGVRENNSGGAGGERQSKRSRRSRQETSLVVDSTPVSEPTPPPEPITPLPRANATATANKKTTSTGKKKKRKSRQVQREESPPREEELAIDPDEPTYCLCDQISYGEMILCDNDLCPIEWFHFSCVALATKPKGKWFCPKCRGDRSTIMKPKAQFLKELERYNKEKEEKS